jgi:hypothetical protein
MDTQDSQDLDEGMWPTVSHRFFSGSYLVICLTILLIIQIAIWLWHF